MGTPKVAVVTGSATILGEGPHWDAKEKALFYVDIKGKAVHKYAASTKEHTTVKIDEGTVSLIVPVKNQSNKYIISVGRSICVLEWDGRSDKPLSLKVIATVDDEEGKQENRFNDGKADPSGRLWAGTMGQEYGPNDFKKNSGSLFTISNVGKVKKHVGEITCSNGLAWSRDNKTMYYIDSFTYKVEAFDFDIQKGVICNRRTVFDFKEHSVVGIPDGMTIDSEDKLWVACFDGSQVIQIDPVSGKLLRSIPIPSPKVTSVVFGGTDLDELFVTSASVDLSEEEKLKFPTAGCTYHVTGVGAKGLPLNSVALN